MTVQIPVYSKQQRGSIRYVSPVEAFVPEASTAKAIAKAVIARAMTDTVVTPVFGCTCPREHAKMFWDDYMDRKCNCESWKRMRNRSNESNHRNKTCGLRNRRLSIKQIIRAQMELH